MFGQGISRAGEILDLGVEYDIIKKSGSWFSYDGNKLAQGAVAAKRIIAENPELADELAAKITEALYSSSGQHRPDAKKSEEAAVEEVPQDNAPANGFDDSLDDEFSIEEDL